MSETLIHPPGNNDADGLETLVSTSAALAAANAVHAPGLLILAEDTDVFAIADGVTAYNSLPKHRALPDIERLSSTARQTNIQGTPVVLTGLSGLTFTVDSVPMKVRAFVSHVEAITTGCSAQLQIVDEVGTLKGYGVGFVGAGGFGEVKAEEEVITVPGTYTRTARLQRGSGTGTINTLLNTAGVLGYIEAVPHLTS